MNLSGCPTGTSFEGRANLSGFLLTAAGEAAVRIAPGMGRKLWLHLGHQLEMYRLFLRVVFFLFECKFGSS